MAGTITTSVIQNDTSSPPTFRNNSVEIGTLCRAWVNFNGTGTVAIRASFNVSSITDLGTGQYTINMTTAMPDTNFAFTSTPGRVSGGATNITLSDMSDSTARTTTSFRVETCQSNTGSLVDPSFMNISVFR